MAGERRWRRGLYLSAAAMATTRSSLSQSYCCEAFSSGVVPGQRGPLHLQRVQPVLDTAVVLDRPNQSAAGTPIQLSTTCKAAADLPEMFLPSRSGLLVASAGDRYGGRASAATAAAAAPPSLAPNVKKIGVIENQSSRNRGVLGFSIDDELELSHHHLSTTTTSLSMAKSAVDTAKWNHPSTATINSEATDFFVSPIKNQLAASLYQQEADHVNHIVPAWFPWIPNRSQIHMLNVKELKEACGARSLKKSGRKAVLQERLWEWTLEQHEKRLAKTENSVLSSLENEIEDDFLPLQEKFSSSKKQPRTKPPKNKLRGTTTTTESRKKKKHLDEQDTQPSSSTANSLAEWARSVDLEHPLFRRREEIRKEQREGKKPIIAPGQQDASPKTPTKEYLSALTKVFEAPSSLYSNLQVKQMYAAAKEADQNGDRVVSKRLLQKLKQATPNDARIFRRLARMESEEGRVDEARKVLQEGLRLHPNNGFLWHGLGQLELNDKKHVSDVVDNGEARRCFEQAIRVQPSLPHPYHALGTLEHTQGRIAIAMKVLKAGIQYCPTNHRLHHALGDLYREAKMLDMAESCYRKSLEHGDMVNHGFAYTSLAYVAYEKGSMADCRQWLNKACALNNGRNSRAWVAFGQMEESEGNVEQAREIYTEALAKYERGLITKAAAGRRNAREEKAEFLKAAAKVKDTRRRLGIVVDDGKHGDAVDDPISRRNQLLKAVPSYRSGDKFINVYRNWARLEERYGDEATVDEIYTRAICAFPRDNQLVLKWAQYYASKGRLDRARARTLFEEACRKASNRHADPYRIYGEFEMSLGNYSEARAILYRGAQAMSVSSDGGLGNRGGMAQLFHTWAICEWHLDNLSRAEVLFDHALRLTDAGQDGSKIRSYILYSIARLEYFRGELELAQHCVALCLKENLMPGGNSRIWALWAEIANAMGNQDLADECEKQAAILKQDEENGGVESLSRFLGLARPASASAAAAASRSNNPAMQQLMRRDPWHHKIFGPSSMTSGFGVGGVKFPRMPEEREDLESPAVDAEV